MNSVYIEYFNFFLTHVDQDFKMETLKARIANILEELSPKEREDSGLVKFLEVLFSRAEEK